MEEDMVLNVEEMTYYGDEVSQEVERKMRIEALARLIVNILLLVNWILTLTGKNPIPFSEDLLYAWVSGIVSSAGLLWGCWWKNNNITGNACKAQTYKDELVAGQINYHEEPDMGDWSEVEEAPEQ